VNCQDLGQYFHFRWRVQYMSGHVVQPLLPNRCTDSHALHDQRHDFLLSCRLDSLTDSNFITWQLFTDSYWQIFTPHA